MKKATFNRHKICMLLTNRFDPDPRVYQEAKSLVKNGYSVTIFCWDRDLKTSPEELINGIKVKRIYIRSKHGRGSSQIFYLFLFWWKAFFNLIFKDFDVFHCHDFDTLPLGFLLGKIKRKKIIYDAHESYADMLVNVNRYIKKVIVASENILIKRIHLLITVGDILKDEFIGRGAKDVCVVGNWKNLQDFDLPESLIEKEKARLNVPKNKIIVSFIGWFGTERKISELIQAAKNESQIFLILGGKGPVLELVQKARAELDNILYLGFVDPSKIPLYTCMSDVIYYGFDPLNPNAKYSAPNKLFEALAAGKALITGNFGEIGKIVATHACGFVLNNGFDINDLKHAFGQIARPEVLKAFNENSKRLGKEIYNWHNAESILLKKYNQLRAI